MKYLPLTFVALLIAALLLGGCKKNSTASEISKLPPATQTGANTFGCLVNGKALLPQNDGLILASPPLRFLYDPANGGELAIVVDNINAAGNIDQTMIIAVAAGNSPRTYNFNTDKAIMGIKFNDYKTTAACSTLYSEDADVTTTAVIRLEKADLTQLIFSGSFDFTLSKAGCTTIQVTNGRFDVKQH